MGPESISPKNAKFADELTACTNRYLREGADLGGVIGSLVGVAAELAVKNGWSTRDTMNRISTIAAHVARMVAHKPE